MYAQHLHVLRRTVTSAITDQGCADFLRVQEAADI